MASEVQHFAEIGIGIEQAYRDMDALCKLMEETGVKISEIVNAKFKIGDIYGTRAAGGDTQAKQILADNEALKRYTATVEVAEKSVSELGAAQTRLDKEVKETKEQLAGMSPALNNADTSVKELVKSYSSLDVKLAETQIELRRVADELRAAQKEAKGMNAEDAAAFLLPKQEEYNRAQAAVNNVRKEIRALDNSQESFFMKSLKWNLVHQGIELTQRALREIIDTMREVETRMMEISRVMGLSAEQSDRLRDSLFGIAQNMGREFDATSEIMLRFAQAGYDVAEATELTRTSLLAMNTAELDAQNSTTSLVGILKQWGLEANSLESILDKLNYTADNNSITTQDLVDALLRSSSAAKNAGISFDELVGIQVALREATGRTGREIGTAVNSIIAYTTRTSSLNVFERLGADVWANEQKTSLNSVMEIWRQLSTLYKTEGDSMVNTLAAQTDMTALMSEEIANATDSLDEYNQMLQTQAKLEGELTDIERKSLTEQFGVYRRNYVISLLENFGKIDQVVSEMDNSIGHSARENARYMETFDAKMKQLITSLQELAVQAGEAGLLDLAKGAVQAAKSVTDLVKNMGGLIPVLITLAGLVAVLKRDSLAKIFLDIGTNIKNIPRDLKSVADGLRGVGTGAGIAANAIVGWIGVATILIGVISQVNSAIKQQEEANKAAAIAAADAAAKETTLLKGYQEEYKRISEGELEAEEKAKALIELQQQIKDIIGEQADGIDIVNGKYREQNQILSEQILERRRNDLESIRTAMILAQEEFNKGLEIKGDPFGDISRELMGAIGQYMGHVPTFLNQMGIEQQIGQLREWQEQLNDASESGVDVSKSLTFVSGTLAELTKMQEEATRATKEYNDASARLHFDTNFKTEVITSQEIFDEFINNIKNSQDLQIGTLGLDESKNLLIEIAYKRFPQYTESAREAIDITIDFADMQKEIANELERLNTDIDTMQSSYRTLSTAIDEYNKSGSVSIDTLQSLLALEPQYLAMLDLENGQLIVNEQSAIALVNALKQEAIAKIQAQTAADLLAYSNGQVGQMSVGAKEAVDKLGDSAETAGGQAKTASTGMAEFAAAVMATYAALGGTVDISKMQEGYDAIIDYGFKAVEKINDIGVSMANSLSLGTSAGGGGSSKDPRIEQINNEIKALQEQSKIEQDKYNDQKKAIQDLAKDREKAYKDELDRVKKLADEEKKADQDRIKRLQEQQKERKKYWDELKKRVKEDYEQQLKALKDIDKENQRRDEREDYEQSREGILKQISEEEKKTGADASRRIKELREELAELEQDEERRLRDVSLEDQIATIEAKMDAELSAIDAQAEADQQRYEDRIAHIQSEMDAEAEQHEFEIERIEAQIEAAQVQAETDIALADAIWNNQKMRLDEEIAKRRENLDVINGVNLEAQASYRAMAEAVSGDFNAMYQAGIDGSTIWYNEVKTKVDNMAESYRLLELAARKAVTVNGTGDSLYPTSHTGSIVSRGGLVNVAPAEIIVNPVLSRRLNHVMDMAENNIHNTYNSHAYQTAQTNYNLNMSLGYGGSNQASNAYRFGAEVSRALSTNLRRSPLHRTR